MDALAIANIAAWKSLLQATPLVLDGGLATSLEARGHDLSGALWSAQLLLDNPAAIEEVNYSHALAGADVLSTASYQVSQYGFEKVGRTVDEVSRAIIESVALARRAAARIYQDRGRTVFVAASVGPYGAVLADGSEYRGDYTISAAALKDFHRERLVHIIACQPDLLAFETIPSLLELQVINELLTEEFDAIPAWVSMSALDDANICDGTPIEVAFAALTANAIIAIGLNCTKPELISPLLKASAEVQPDVARVVYSNAGRTWDATNREWLDAGAEYIPAEIISEWQQLGTQLIGGCCGLGETHLTSVRAVLKP